MAQAGLPGAGWPEYPGPTHGSQVGGNCAQGAFVGGKHPFISRFLAAANGINPHIGKHAVWRETNFVETERYGKDQKIHFIIRRQAVGAGIFICGRSARPEKNVLDIFREILRNDYCGGIFRKNWRAIDKRRHVHRLETHAHPGVQAGNCPVKPCVAQFCQGRVRANRPPAVGLAPIGLAHFKLDCAAKLRRSGKLEYCAQPLHGLETVFVRRMFLVMHIADIKSPHPVPAALNSTSALAKPGTMIMQAITKILETKNGKNFIGNRRQNEPY